MLAPQAPTVRMISHFGSRAIFGPQWHPGGTLPPTASKHRSPAFKRSYDVCHTRSFAHTQRDFADVIYNS